MIVEFLRRANLLDDARVEKRDARAHRHGFHLVMCHVDERCLDALVDLGDFRAGLHAQFRIQVRKWFIQEEDLRIAHDGSAKCNTLALTAGEFFGLTLEKILQTENFGCIIDPFLDFIFGQVAQLEAKGHVVVDGHVGIECIVLEHHGDVAIFGVNSIDDAITDFDIPLAGLLQTSDHAQTGTFTTTGGTYQYQEFFVLDIQGDIMDDFYFAETLVDVLKLDTSHYGLLLFALITVKDLPFCYLPNNKELSLGARIAVASGKREPMGPLH